LLACIREVSGCKKDLSEDLAAFRVETAGRGEEPWIEDEPLIADHNGWHSCPVLSDIPMFERSSEVSGCTVDLSDWTTFRVGPGEVPVFASAAASCATGRLLRAL